MPRAPARVLALLVGVVLTPAWLPATAEAAPPPVERLFGCPLRAPAEAFRALPEWHRVASGALDVSYATPPGWEATEASEVISIRPAKGGATLTLRRGRLVSPERLAFVRRSVELTELGPSHAGPACERDLVERIAQIAGWERVEVGVYGRPLAGRQRSYALFAALPDGTLTVVVTVTWSKRAGGPDLDLVRRLLGGVVPRPIEG